MKETIHICEECQRVVVPDGGVWGHPCMSDVFAAKDVRCESFLMPATVETSEYFREWLETLRFEQGDD
jgi:hypothetical protein